MTRSPKAAGSLPFFGGGDGLKFAHLHALGQRQLDLGGQRTARLA